MTHIYGLETATFSHPSLVTIGVFDGVHRGHQALVKQLVERAHQLDYLAVVLTFFPHPDVVLRGLTGRYYLTTPEQRADLLEQLGVDVVVTHPFDDALRHMRAHDFVDRLLKHLSMRTLWVGEDFALGYQREGDVAFLRAEGEKRGFDVETVELVAYRDDGAIINSTAIRGLLDEGRVEQVADWLGRGYCVRGVVVQGDKRGRTIGFPTANLDVWSEQRIPANGVYAGWCKVGGEVHKAVTNIGVRPTFDGTRVTVEAHLLDFSRDIYGEDVALTFEKRLRGEMKFNGIEALVAQISQDAAAGRAFLEAQGHSSFFGKR